MIVSFISSVRVSMRVRVRMGMIGASFTLKKIQNRFTWDIFKKLINQEDFEKSSSNQNCIPSEKDVLIWQLKHHNLNKEL